MIQYGLIAFQRNLILKRLKYGQLKLYEQIHILQDDNMARMHGSAVVSIAVGKNVGVAPGSGFVLYCC